MSYNAFFTHKLSTFYKNWYKLCDSLLTRFDVLMYCCDRKRSLLNPIHQYDFEGENVLNFLAQKRSHMALGDEWPDLLTVREVAKILRVSPLTIKRWGKRGKLPAIRINSRGDRRYKKEAVLWLLGQQQKGAI